MSALSGPLGRLAAWLEDARAAGIRNADAMTVATASPDGAPSARVVLLRTLDERGLVFYTSYESDKAVELAENPRAAAVLYWEPLERQARVSGAVERVSRLESERYWRSRPREHQLAASASRQSRELVSRAELEARYASLDRAYRNREVPLPGSWGGFRIAPASVEFWEGRESRLHDRVRFIREPGGRWRSLRLEP